MKKSKKLLSVLCAVCMIMAMAVPAFAMEIQPRDVTTSTEVKFNSNSTSQTITWPVARDYGYWKIAVRNNSSADMNIKITQGSPSGTEIWHDMVPANTVSPLLSFTAEDGSPLSAGTYYIILQSKDSGKNLDGTLWYKFGSTFDDVNN